MVVEINTLLPVYPCYMTIWWWRWRHCYLCIRVTWIYGGGDKHTVTCVPVLYEYMVVEINTLLPVYPCYMTIWWWRWRHCYLCTRVIWIYGGGDKHTVTCVSVLHEYMVVEMKTLLPVYPCYMNIWWWRWRHCYLCIRVTWIYGGGDKHTVTCVPVLYEYMVVEMKTLLPVYHIGNSVLISISIYSYNMDTKQCV